MRRQSAAVIANRERNGSVLAPRKANPDITARTVAIGVLDGIGDQLIGDERDCDSAVGRNIDPGVGIDPDIAME